MSQKLEKHGFCWIISKHLFLEKEGEREYVQMLYIQPKLWKNRMVIGELHAVYYMHQKNLKKEEK